MGENRYERNMGSNVDQYSIHYDCQTRMQDSSSITGLNLSQGSLSNLGSSSHDRRLHVRWEKRLMEAKDALNQEGKDNKSSFANLKRFFLPAQKKSSKRRWRRRNVVLRILNGKWFTEPSSVTYEKIYCDSGTGDIFLQRHIQRIGAIGGLALSPEIVLGLQSALNGMHQPRSVTLEPWNFVGIIVKFPLGKKYVLSCGKVGIELHSLQEILFACAQSGISCAWRKLQWTEISAESSRNSIDAIVRLAGLARRGDCTWEAVAEVFANEEAYTKSDVSIAALVSSIEPKGRLSVSASLESIRRRPSFSNANPTVDVSKIAVGNLMRRVLSRVRNVCLQLSQEQITAAKGLFHVICKRIADREARALELEREREEEKKWVEAQQQQETMKEATNNSGDKVDEKVPELEEAIPLRKPSMFQNETGGDATNDGMIEGAQKDPPSPLLGPDPLPDEQQSSGGVSVGEGARHHTETLLSAGSGRMGLRDAAVVVNLVLGLPVAELAAARVDGGRKEVDMNTTEITEDVGMRLLCEVVLGKDADASVNTERVTVSEVRGYLYLHMPVPQQ